MLDRRWRKSVEQGLGPVGDRLRRMGVTADALTVFGLLCSVATAVLIASGHLIWAVVGVIVVRRLRPARRRDRTGQRPGEPPRRVLRLRHRPRVRRVAVRRRGLVPDRPVAVLRDPGVRGRVHLDDDLVRAGAGRGPRHRRARRPDGAGRAVRVPRRRSRVQHPRPVLWIMLVLTSFTTIQRFVRVYRAGRPPAAPRARAARESPRHAAAYVVDDAPRRRRPPPHASHVVGTPPLAAVARTHTCGGNSRI